MPKKTKSNIIAMKPNKVIQAGQRLGVFQNKVLNGALAALEFNVGQSFEELNSENREREIQKISQRTCKINIQPLFDNFKEMHISPGSENYNYIEEKLEELVKQVLKIKDKENGGVTIMNIISFAHYNPSNKTVEIRFSQEIVPTMIDMFQDGFTKIRLASMFKFRSPYSMRIYEELCRVKNMENVKKYGHILTVTDLCFLLEIDRDKEYRRYDNLKARVLLSAQKEIHEKSEISFKIEELRRGKSVYQIRFYDITEKEQETLQLQLFPDEMLNVKTEEVAENSQVQEFIEAVVIKEEAVEQTNAETITVFEQGDLKDISKFTQEQAQKLETYLEGIFSADEIKDKHSFEYIEFYYKKAIDLDIKGVVKEFPSFLYDMIVKDKHKYYEKKQKEADKKEAERKEKENKWAQIYETLSQEKQEEYLSRLYNKFPEHKEKDKDEISHETKWMIGKQYGIDERLKTKI